MHQQYWESGTIRTNFDSSDLDNIKTQKTLNKIKQTFEQF